MAPCIIWEIKLSSLKNERLLSFLKLFYFKKEFSEPKK